MRTPSEPTEAAQPGAQLRLLRVHAGLAAYGVDMALVRGIQRRDQLALGVDGASLDTLVVDGGEVPVRRLAQLLGETASASADADRMVLLLAASPCPLALVVDRVAAVRGVTAADVVPMPRLAQPGAREVFANAVLLGPEVLPLLDPTPIHPEGPGLAALPPAPRRPTFQSGPAEPAGGSGRSQRLLRIRLVEAPEPLAMGVSLLQVAEILAVPALRTLPGLAPYVRGLFAWRGRAVPAVALATTLGAPHEPAVDRMVVVQGTNGHFLGLLAPAGLEVESLTATCHALPWTGPAGAPILGSFETQSGPLVLLDVDRVLAG